jgi:hypothetical protein
MAEVMTIGHAVEEADRPETVDGHPKPTPSGLSMIPRPVF